MLRTSRIYRASIIILLLFTLPGSLHTAFASSTLPGKTKYVQQSRISHTFPLTSFRLRGIDGPYHTEGNKILGADNVPYLFHGVARDDLEYFCKGDGHYTAKELAYMGPGTNTAHETYWGGNVVRLPLSENFWLYGHPSDNCSSQQYRSFVKQTIDTLTTLNLNVIINLEWTNAGGQAVGSGTQLAMPDADSILFWTQVASIYANSPNVLFEIFNEPHIYNWNCWVNGCPIMNDQGTDRQRYSYQGIGMQKLVDTVRSTGANNIILVGGLSWGYDLKQLDTYHLNGTNLVYDTHPYNYSGKQPFNWEADFGSISDRYALFSAEFGSYKCEAGYVSQLIDYLDAHNISWVGWAWVLSDHNPCIYPVVIKDYNGTPLDSMGTTEYQRMKGYLNALVNAEVPEKRG
ncbi:MAG: glycoside hydrolase family 5 protein [Chloroflexota bacterium]|nr:glycoside hydrolase family 5 protein [Chloroflexota bacterium]